MSAKFETVSIFKLNGFQMRKIVVFVLAVAMVLGGLCLAAFELFFSRIAYVRFIIGGIMLLKVWAYLLWADFLAPTLGIRTWED